MQQNSGLNDHFTEVASQTEGQKLYHCVNKPIEGDALLPTCKRTVFEHEDTYLFAATKLSKALAFAFEYNKECPDIICNGGIAGTDHEYALLCKGSKTLASMQPVTVYEFSAEGFNEAWPGTDSRQFVSNKQLLLSKAKVVLQTDKPEDLMQHGLQIFSTEKTFEELGGSAFLDTGEAPSSEEWLMKLVKDGKLRWENQERHINPTQKLADIVNAQPKRPFSSLGPNAR